MSEPSRHTRRREQTRARLVAAARALVAEHASGEKIAIADITDRADLGLGTFYNYFETKQDAFAAVLEIIREGFQAELDELRTRTSDPAMIVTATLMHGMRAAVDHPEWAALVDHAGQPPDTMLEQDPAQCLADLSRGQQAGRFRIDNVEVTRSLLQAMTRHVAIEIRAGRMPRTAIDETARNILRMLGMPDVVTRALTQSRLPTVAQPVRRLPAQNVAVGHAG